MTDLNEILADGSSQEKFLVNPSLPFLLSEKALK